MQFIDDYFLGNGKKLHFSQEAISFVYQGFHIVFNDTPYLIGNDNTFYLPPYTQFILEKVIKGAKDKGISTIPNISVPESLKKYKFLYCKDFVFHYSAVEYYFIPGLWRNQNDGFLTPVYFDLVLLDKYSRRSDYNIRVDSSTYGYISYKDEWGIAYGINKNKSIIMWLGDIDKLPKREKQYLLSENIEPEFEIHSEFYNAQIGNEWSKPSVESQTFSLRNNVSKNIYDLYNISLYQLEGEISKTIGDLQKPVLWQRQHIASTIESLNRIFVESIAVSSLKDLIIERIPNTTLKGLKGLKLLNKFLSEVVEIDNIDEIMCPFFVLTDYRNGLNHLASNDTYQEKMESVFTRLGLEYNEQSHEEMYSTLFIRLHKSLKAIDDKLTNDEESDS